MPSNRIGQQTCRRGYTDEGSGPCPVCWPGRSRKRLTAADGSNEVDAYISHVPKEAPSKLKQLRAATKQVAPDATEGISYKMPFYSCHGRLTWFASMKGYIGLDLRPPAIAEHARELAAYKTTKSAVQFPLEKKLPVPLIKSLAKARLQNRARPAKT
jgi:uncharacterized protein YdhG (YjbR/CyaY superfamily)